MIDKATDETSLEISETGAKFSTKGSAGARAAHSLIDMVSPFTEGGGAIGDVIRYFRQDMAIRATQRSLQIAETLNIPIKPVPAKFLVDWVEKASLEDPEDNSLTELWAGLLVSAGNQISPAHYQFKRIVSEMTPAHIELLSIICDHNFDHYAPYTPVKDYSALTSLFEKEKDELVAINDLEADPMDILNGLDNNTFKVERFSIVTVPKFSMNENLEIARNRTVFNNYTDAHVIKHFIEVGIIDRIERSIKVKCENLDNRLAHYLKFTALYLTPFGSDFLEACVPTKLSKVEEHQNKTPSQETSR